LFFISQYSIFSLSFEKEAALKVGYSRVSTSDQDLSAQTDSLSRAGCDSLFSDTASGKDADRPGLRDCLSYLRPGDQLVVWKLDRLGRSLKDLIALMSELEARQIQFSSLTEGIDTATPGGRFFFHVLGAFAEMERELIRERTRAGLNAARTRGHKGGRPCKLTLAQARAARLIFEEGATVQQLERQFGVKAATLYRYWNQLKRNPQAAPTTALVPSPVLPLPLDEDSQQPDRLSFLPSMPPERKATNAPKKGGAAHDR
jgi:DNA invertase Pin-like site-specific DNA recombinase